MPCYSAWVGSPEPLVAEACARAGFDTVVIDLQHGQADELALVRAAFPVRALGVPLIARIPVGAFATASRLIDAGALGVIAPMVNSVADAVAFADAMKYPPLGRRSFGPNRACAVGGVDVAGYLATANTEILAFAMIETREALAALDDILAVPGIDGVFVGPYDLSFTLSGGRGPEVDGAETVAALRHVASRAKAAGKFAATYAATGAVAKGYAATGYDLVAIASDPGYLEAGARMMLSAARG
ncbi:HpcH/HpaI aldolase family protein [Methylobrevis pamukkalensis]|uniref:5-keto-4-deoxy-D-glucarate aldolase n=1 Tax=Methylobrevis pamukkalensis TaxID=1439726 RepID=A0A1E3GXH6_9HYPH|nr:aldolase/citrate lyase family protein [Methylobrevis pamukkalensis]ODN68625.1 5-keto-4-deoxy-D-glucarate aldolase [Methylobrevis pamukkalensis]